MSTGAPHKVLSTDLKMHALIAARFAWFKLYSQDRLYSPLPPNLQLLEAKAEGISDELNNHHQGMVASAVYCMKKKALKCLRAMGGTFEGRCI